MEPLSVMDWEPLAEAKLGRLAWDYYSSGADDEITLRENRAAFQRIALHYRVLVDVGRIDTACQVLGQPASMPILIAPTAFHRLAHPDGERATARAAAEIGTLMMAGTLATTRIEDVIGLAAGALWFQLYVYRDRAVTEGLVRRAEAAGCRALVLTVDVPVLGRRERDVRNRFVLPDGLSLENMLPAGLDRLPDQPTDSGLAAYFQSLIDPTLSWRDLDWLRSLTRLPLVIKGIVRPDDALRAVDAGVDAIVVSNHGGRQLDTAPATIDVLPAIADAVNGRVEIYMDGGVRRGTDVVKAIALGARAVLVGRPVLWGLAVNGARGVADVLAMLRSELERAMALCGCPSVRDISRDLVSFPSATRR